MAGSLDFNGLSDYLGFGLGETNISDSYSIVVIARAENAAINQEFISGEDDIFAFGFFDTGALSAYDGSTESVSTLLVPRERWALYGITKAAGTVRPWFHLQEFGSTMRRSEGSAALLPVTQSLGWVIGRLWGTGGWRFDGQIAAVAIWDRDLLDEEVEQCTRWHGILDLEPDWFVRLDGDPPFTDQYELIESSGTTHSALEPEGFWGSSRIFLRLWIDTDRFVPVEPQPIPPGSVPRIQIARRAFPQAQKFLAGAAVRTLAERTRVGWHGSALDPETGATCVVRLGGPYEEVVGDVLLVTYKDRSVFVYCTGRADLPDGREVSLSRRAFFALALLSETPLEMRVEVTG